MDRHPIAQSLKDSLERRDAETIRKATLGHRSFALSLDDGYQRRHVWQARINTVAQKLDVHEHTPAVADLLRELFELIGERG